MKRSKPTKLSNQEFRRELEGSFVLACELAGTGVVLDCDSCYQRGIDAFLDALKYGSVFRELAKVKPLLVSAKVNLHCAVQRRAYSKYSAAIEDLAYDQSSSAFGLFVSTELLDEREQPQTLDGIHATLDPLTAVLTDERIAAASSSELSRSELDDWSRYVAGYLGVTVLLRMWGGAPDLSRIDRITRSSSFDRYEDLVEELSILASLSRIADEDLIAFRRIYSKFVSLEYYQMSLIHGFLFSTAYVFSVIRCGGALGAGLVTMFDKEWEGPDHQD